MRRTWLGIAPIGRAGFCALRLAQRLLDPVPAGNCKLQTLRQYYRLPERGAHTALGDVGTVANLFATVLRPIEKAKVEAMKARLFARLREHFQRRDRLRLVIAYRRKYLESLVRQGEEEVDGVAPPRHVHNAAGPSF